MPDTEQLAAIFNEWLRQYEADPDRFRDPSEFAADGHDYGECCARTFLRIAGELGR